MNVAGDAKKELLFIWCETTSTNGACPSGRIGYARPGADPTAAWTFTPDRRLVQHGLGPWPRRR